MSEEEIIARVQNLIDYINFKPDGKYNTHFAIIAYPEEQWFNAIQGLLDLYNKEKEERQYEKELRLRYERRYNSKSEENKKLKEKNKILFTQEDINKENELGYGQGVYYTNEAWEDKIKAKIEELKYREENVVQYTDNKVILYAIQKVLQELLEEKER